MITQTPGHAGADEPSAGSRATKLWPLVVVVVTFGYAWIPYQLSPWFFQRGDTAAQFAPTWFHLGELVRAGQWPVWLDPEAWAGGNYGVEALFGIYNPINALIWVPMSLASDLMLSTFLVKATVLVALALGTYVLAREYEAVPWAAAMLAIALPFSGFTLYWDGGSWPSGLIAFAYTPWVWWVFRRCLRGATNPWWAFLLGVLAATQGNPYGVLALVIVGAGLVLEGLVARNWPGVTKLTLIGLCVAAFLPLVYLPLLQSADLAYRSGGPLFANNGKLTPTISDLIGLSSPTFVPPIRAITGPMQVPATYFSWLLVPLLPWLRFGVLRRRATELLGVAFVTLAYFLLTVGPSTLWLFRWPLRLIEYCYLGLAVALAIVIGEGLHRSWWKRRAAATLGLIGVAGYLAWAADPAAVRRVALGVAVTGVLAALVLAAHRFRPGSSVLVAGLCILGTGVVLTTQVSVFGENESSRVWHLPSDVAELRSRFAGREPVVLQFADLKPLQDRGQRKLLKASWADFLPGSMYQVADVPAVNSYTGMGFRPFSKRLCMSYEGLTKPCGYRNVWRPAGPGQPPLVDAMKVQTLVVATPIAAGVEPGPEWEVTEKTARVTVLERTDELPWPDSRLSWAGDGIQVTEARTVAELEESVEFTAEQDGELVFATLGWPGWRAAIDGRTVPARYGPTGLLTVDVPADSQGTVTVTYRPPGLPAGLVGAGLGTLGAALLGATVAIRRMRGLRRGSGGAGVAGAPRRDRVEPRSTAHVDHGPSADPGRGAGGDGVGGSPVGRRVRLGPDQP
ncbi:MAG: hypothetical protein ACRCYQ_02210 [Nocardioides sp.]